MIFKTIFKRPGREDIFAVGERRLDRLKAEGRFFRHTKGWAWGN